MDFPSFPDCLSFDLHPVFQDLLIPARILVGRCDIVYGLVILVIIVKIEPSLDPLFSSEGELSKIDSKFFLCYKFSEKRRNKNPL